jgi:DNA-binding NarL/FixJ family response regulator
VHQPVRVVLADDHPAVRQGFALILDAFPDVQVVAQAASADDLLAAIVAVAPDVAVVDIDMPGIDGLEAVRRVHARHPEVRCLILTVHAERTFVRQAAAAGGSGYLLKSGSPTDLVRGIVEVAAGRAALHPSVTQYLVDEIAGGAEEKEDKALSRRENDVLQLMARGMDTRQIAAELGISAQTVKTHVARLYTRMGTRDRTQTVASAIRRGLVA